MPGELRSGNGIRDRQNIPKIRNKVWSSFIRLLLPLGLSCLVLQAEPLDSHPLHTWSWRNPYPTAHTLEAVAHGNGTFVAVGGGGTILTSTNGQAWTQTLFETEAWLLDVAYGNGRFVVVGDLDTILVSTNGSRWSKYSTGVRRIQSVTYVNGFFRAFGDVGLFRSTILTSLDGAQWETNSFLSVRDIAHGNGTFVSVGPSGNIFSSADTTAWTWRSSGGTQGFTNVVFGNGRFVAAGGPAISTSVDGITWATRNLGGSVYFENGQFIRVSGGVWTSPDAVNWIQQSPGTKAPIKDLVFGDGRYVAVGETGSILMSPDASHWTMASGGSQADLASAAFGNDVFVAAGSGGTMLTSRDGVAWMETAAGLQSETINSVIFAGGMFAGVGNEAALPGGSAATVMSSVDGFSWNKLRFQELLPLNDLSYGKGLFVAVGGSGILTSADAVNWTPRPASTELPLRSVAFGNDRFVAIGGLRFFREQVTNVLVTSTDGSVWRNGEPPKTGVLRSVQFANGSFYLADDNFGLFTSTDGETWTKASVPRQLPDEGVTHGNEVYVTVSGDMIYTSPDASRWSVAKKLGTSLRAAAFGKGTFVVVGSKGAILQSAETPDEPISLQDLRLVSGPRLEMKASAPPRWPLTIQSSTDLVNWQSVSDVTEHTGTIPFSIPLNGQLNRRFYRVGSP